jgi:hypothetical protein
MSGLPQVEFALDPPQLLVAHDAWLRTSGSNSTFRS